MGSTPADGAADRRLDAGNDEFVACYTGLVFLATLFHALSRVAPMVRLSIGRVSTGNEKRRLLGASSSILMWPQAAIAASTRRRLA